MSELSAEGGHGAVPLKDVPTGEGVTPSEPEWPLYEVFVRGKRGLNHVHVGSLHAADDRMALLHARDVYTRRNEGVSIWVVRADAITACLPAFTGTIAQVPPKFSAIKIEGERAYDLARDGQEVELDARPVEIHDLALTETPDAETAIFEAECGKGTYVRALARDMGRVLGCLGHVSALRRTQVGSFGENDMISLAELEGLCQKAAAGEGSLADALLPVETALDDIPALAVSRADAARLQRGQAVLLRGRDAPIFRGTVHVTTSGELIALAEVDRGEIIPKRVFNLAGLKGSAGKRQGH